MALNLNFLYQVVSYAVILIVFFVVIEFYSKGFILKYIRVRSSRGRKVLVRVIGQVTDYLEVGEIAEGMVKFGDRSTRGRSKKIVSLPDQGGVTRLLGVHWVYIDEKKNAVLLSDFSAVTGYDAERNNNLLMRALYRPETLNTNQKLMLVGVGLIVLGVIVIYIKLGSIETLIKGLGTVEGGII